MSCSVQREMDVGKGFCGECLSFQVEKEAKETILNQQVKRAVVIILGTYAVTMVAVLIYAICLFQTAPASATLGIPFGFIVLTGLALFTESIIFAIVFYRHLATTWVILFPVILSTSIVPIYFGYKWYENRPVVIPKPGPLPVSMNKYKADSKLVVEDYLRTELDSNGIDIFRDTVQTAFIDTIFYSIDKRRFFAIIVAVANDNGGVKYCANYRVGRLATDKWQLGNPKGNIIKPCLKSMEQLKYDLRQHYYKSYSINNSSDKPEIWEDEYIFNFRTDTAN